MGVLLCFWVRLIPSKKRMPPKGSPHCQTPDPAVVMLAWGWPSNMGRLGITLTLFSVLQSVLFTFSPEVQLFNEVWKPGEDCTF